MIRGDFHGAWIGVRGFKKMASGSLAPEAAMLRTFQPRNTASTARRRAFGLKDLGVLRRFAVESTIPPWICIGGGGGGGAVHTVYQG